MPIGLKNLAELYRKSVIIKNKNITAQEFQEYVRNLSSLLNRFDKGTHDVLPFVSRIKRNLILGLTRSEERAEIKRKEAVPRFVIITAVWKRAELTNLFYRYYSNLKVELSGVCDIDILAVIDA